MSALLTLDRVSLTAPDGRVLFTDLTLALGRERLGLVGRNGSGKSTLLRAILGEVGPTSGSLTVAGRVGMLRQTPSVDKATAADLLGIRMELEALARLERGEGSLEDAETADWLLPSRTDEALASLGLPRTDLDRPPHRSAAGSGRAWA